MSKQYKVAVVGATGAVGETMLSILAERDFLRPDALVERDQRAVGVAQRLHHLRR